ncbi:MAG: polysaccharide export protein [Magnetococcales bacterium]|nr:polysaccharide export protein [Magnetococcales bacterium]
MFKQTTTYKNRSHLKTVIGLFSLFCLMAISVLQPSTGFCGQNDYRLGVGDTISIKVFDEPDLSVKVLLGDTASFSFPLLGEIQVEGMTVKQVESLITMRLKGSYLIKPKVSVLVVAYRKFYVKGEVKSPGEYSYSPQLTMDKVISLAGGFTNRANKKKIYIQSEKNSKKRTRRANLNTIIQPGDVITVERRFF